MDHLVDEPGVAEVAAEGQQRNAPTSKEMAIAEVLAEQIRIGPRIVDLAGGSLAAGTSSDDLGRPGRTAAKPASNGYFVTGPTCDKSQ